MDNYPVGVNYNEAKGPGRGWWGPPRGTHTSGQSGETAVEATIKKLAAKIIDAKVEHLYIVDDDGNIIASATGEWEGVDVPTNAVNKLAGNNMLHSHPGVSTSFSQIDVELACKHNIKEMYLVGSRAGKQYLYRFAPGPGIRERVALPTELRKISSDVFDEMSNSFSKGYIDAEEMTYEYRHQTWIRANQFYAKKGLAFNYSREEL